MSDSRTREGQKAKWAFGDLWKKLHFGHLSGGENWAGMEAAYRFGLGPYRKFVLKAISARIERKNLLTFGIEFPPVHEQPVRLKLSPRACIIVVKSTGETKQVIRDWPDDVEMDPGIKIYDEDSEEYISVQSFHSRGESDVSIEVNADLIGRNNLLVKGRPIRVIAESGKILPETIQIAEVNHAVLEAKTSISGDEHELLVPLHQSEFKQSQVNGVNVISVKKWKPKQGTQLLDGSKVLVDSWTGQTDMTIKSAPTGNELLTSEGIRIPWKKVEQDGVWVKPFADVDSDAVIDPMDTLFEDKEIRKLQTKAREEFSILERNREAQMIRLSSEPRAKELTLPIGIGDLMNQKAAIERLQAAPLAHHIPLMELTTRLDHDYLKAWESFKPSNAPIVPWLTRVGSGAEGSEEQRRFVLKALSTPDFAFLEGPPGSGKTETIGELILQLLSDTNNNCRILLCGSTQASIDNVLSRFGENDLVQPLRIVNSKRWRNKPEDRDALVYDSDIHRWTEPEQVDDLRQRLGDAGKDLTDANLSEMVLRRSNLVCATIGGVSQHPSIKQVLQKDSQVPPKAIFDVLIIDEASKTTFTEFLIPAIFCRKWILVGDVAQLPPFSDQADIAGMLDLLESDDKIPPASLRKACLNIQSVIDDRHLRKIPRLLIESSETVLAMEMEWRARKIRGEKTLQDNRLDRVRAAFISPLVSKWDGEGMLCIDTSSLKPSNWEEIGRNRLKLMDCELIVISESDAKQFSLSMLPSTHLTPGMMSNNTSLSSKILPTRFQFRLSLERQRLMMQSEGEDRWRDPFKMNRGLNGESTSWGRQVAWRIQRVYEMQTSENTDLRDQYLNQVKTLLPAASNQENWAKEVELIRCFSLPSVLESLQHGFMGRKGKGAASDELAPRFPTTLSLGFPSESKRTRFESIKHQHRMHWSISRFPREEFYAPEEQDNDWRLLDAEQTLQSRNNFKFILNNSNTQLPQQQRRFWVDVKGQQTDKGNPAEAKRAAEILEDLIEWFESEEEVERVSLTVALLSPYVNQSRTLRVQANSILQKKSNTMKGNRGTIHLSHGRKITVYCSTVDKFQGQEADVVLLSLRNTTKQGNIDSPNRANVALTRAREALFIIGNKSNYSNAYDPMLKRLATGTEAGNDKTYWRRTK